MKKSIKLNEILLLAVAGMFELFQEIRDPFGLISSYYENYYGFVPARWKKERFGRLVGDTIRSGLVKKELDGRQTRLVITEKGLEKIRSSFPLLATRPKPWDSRWRVVVFDIEEKQRSARTRLRFVLKNLKFGLLQKSVWISPHDFFDELTAWTDRYKLHDTITLFEIQKTSIKDPVILAQKLWNTDDLNSKYKTIYRELLQLHKESPSSSDHERFASIQNRFINTVKQDPFLPQELLPDDWHFQKASKLIKDVRSELAQREEW